MEAPHAAPRQRESVIAKEFVFGLLAILLGAYNILTMFGVLSVPFAIEIPQTVANALLIIVGLLLWITAFKLSRHKYYTRRLL